MHDVTLAAACLVYAAAVLRAFERLPIGAEMIRERTVIWPGFLLLLSLGLPLSIGPLRRGLSRSVWRSFQAGFGQSATSVLVGLSLPLGLALFMYWQIAGAEAGGRYPAGVFAGYAAGIGILGVQAVLVRLLEKLPDVRQVIETEEGGRPR